MGLVGWRPQSSSDTNHWFILAHSWRARTHVQLSFSPPVNRESHNTIFFFVDCKYRRKWPFHLSAFLPFPTAVVSLVFWLSLTVKKAMEDSANWETKQESCLHYVFFFFLCPPNSSALCYFFQWFFLVRLFFFVFYLSPLPALKNLLLLFFCFPLLLLPQSLYPAGLLGSLNSIIVQGGVGGSHGSLRSCDSSVFFFCFHKGHCSCFSGFSQSPLWLYCQKTWAKL